MADKQLNHLLTFAVDPAKQADPLESSRSVSRITLRQVLLAELGEIVHFDKFYSYYQQNPDSTVTAFFEDGTSVTSDLLVGADGGNSRVRQQLLPQAVRKETGAVAIIGKVPLTPAIQAELVSHQLDWATIVFGPKGRGFFSAVHDLSSKTAERTEGSIGTNEAALLEEGQMLFENTNDYYFWALVAKQKNYPISGDLTQLAGSDLLQLAQSMVSGWHPILHHLLTLTEPTTVIATPLRIATPVAPWQSANITLLGDAIHSMPPTRGIGGNTALKDAQLLCQKIAEIARQEKPTAQALYEYTIKMLRYSFAAVKGSKQSLDMIVLENRFGSIARNILLRCANFFMRTFKK